MQRADTAAAGHADRRTASYLQSMACDCLAHPLVEMPQGHQENSYRSLACTSTHHAVHSDGLTNKRRATSVLCFAAMMGTVSLRDVRPSSKDLGDGLLRRP